MTASRSASRGGSASSATTFSTSRSRSLPTSTRVTTRGRTRPRRLHTKALSSEEKENYFNKCIPRHCRVKRRRTTSTSASRRPTRWTIILITTRIHTSFSYLPRLWRSLLAISSSTTMSNSRTLTTTTSRSGGRGPQEAPQETE
ncbi:unnamed protein product [Sphagnum troendelagicum]|uniref:Uncharacterized protein n=1 Tax=Sphagnum troendelagicum TaxID=128251 RepID=A0ABP0TYF7_9BRYO